MHLSVGHSWTYVDTNLPTGLLDPVTSYLPKGYFFRPAYKQGFSDGRVRLVEYDRSAKKHRFPTGLLKLVLEHLDSRSWHYTISDNREFNPPDKIVTELFDEKLGKIYLDRGKYSYQADAAQAAIFAGCGVVRIATGGGKSEVGSAIIASLNKQTIWLTHRENLARQARARLGMRLQRPIGLLGDGVEDLQNVTVAMVQTVANVLKNPEKRASAHAWLMGCELLVGDEIHHVDGGSRTWYHGILSLPAAWRIGLSATPKFTGEGLHLLAVTGNVVYSITAAELIKLGVLVPPRIWFVKVQNEKLPRKTPWATVYSQLVVNNYARNKQIADVVKIFAKEGKPPLVLVKRLNHGQNIIDCLNFQGLTAGWVHGKVDADERDKILEKLWSRELDAVVAVAETLGEGTDLPPLKAVLNATASRGGGDASEDGSGRVTIQILGRGLRSYAGKTHCEYVDFADSGHKSLIEATKDRVNTLESEGYGQFINYWSEYPVDGESECRGASGSAVAKGV